MYKLVNCMGSVTAMEQMINTFAKDGMEVVSVTMDGGRMLVLFKTTEVMTATEVSQRQGAYLSIAEKDKNRQELEAMREFLFMVWRKWAEGQPPSKVDVKRALIEICGCPEALLREVE